MSSIQAIPRMALTWLLVAQVLVIAPLLFEMPLWVVGLWLFCAGWRVQVFRMRARFPNGLARAGLMTLTALGVFLSHGSLIGLDAGAVLLVAAFILKLVELRSRRDALVLIFLGFFVVVVGYLFDDSLLAALYSLLPIVALLAALIGLQQSSLANRPLVTLKLAGVMLLQALPLMLVLFLLFPRLGPLWSLPNPQRSLTGLSDSMAPADVAELSRSPELAFRVSFDSLVPERRDLYWRALTLEHFDGRRWSQVTDRSPAVTPQWRKQGAPLSYSIIMQPSGKPWLFALDVGVTRLPGVQQMEDFRLQRQVPVLQNLMYEVQSWPAAVRQPELPNAVRRRDLQLPDSGDPQARQWAAQLRQAHTHDAGLVQALLQHFNQQPYGYTLKPPPVGSNSIDEFLFRTQRGFCAHYAGAMTFVLRAAGIPARVVAGYQGGEFNASANYLMVRQYDAHAWVEYWQTGRGWVSVDPTFQVAPERIEQGLEQALSQEDSFLEDTPFSPLRYRDLQWLNALRLSWDSINYNWQRWVLGYRSEQQQGLMQRWFGTFDWQHLALTLLVCCGVVLAGVALWLFKPWRRERDPLQRQLRRFEAVLARSGLHRHKAEGVRDFAARAAVLLPRQTQALNAFAQAFEAQRYGGREAAPEQLRTSLKHLQRELPRWSLRRNRQ